MEAAIEEELIDVIQGVEGVDSAKKGEWLGAVNASHYKRIMAAKNLGHGALRACLERLLTPGEAWV